MSKLTIQLKIETFIEFDGGYYRNNNMEKIEEMLQNKIRQMRVFIQDGSSEPAQRPAKIELLGIHYTPKDE